MNEQALSMAEAQKKLRELEKHLPKKIELACQFGCFVADRLNDTHQPQDFVMVCELAIRDLQRGVDGFSGKAINNKLVGYPAQMYTLMHRCIPVMAEAVFPKEFADGVKRYIDEVEARIGKSN